MYRITLTDEQRRELRERTRQAGLAPSTRDRLEMVRLADAGWSVPRIARHLGQHEQTVRTWIKAFLAGGCAALPNKPRGGKASALTAPLRETVRAEVAQGTRTWTAAQLAEALRPHGVALGTCQVRRYLKLLKAGYRRTASTLKHKQDAAKVARAETALGGLKKKQMPVV